MRNMIKSFNDNDAQTLRGLKNSRAVISLVCMSLKCAAHVPSSRV